MKKIIVKLAAYAGFLICLTMQVYLGLLLTTTDAWAQTEEVKEPVKQEAVAPVATAPKAATPKAASKAVQKVTETVTTEKTETLDKDAKIAEKIEKAMKKAGFPFKDLKIDKGNFNVTIDDDGKEHKVNIDLADIIEKAGKVKRERSAWENMEDVVVPLAFFIFLFFIIRLVHESRAKAKKEQMETIKLMVEKGQPIPQGIFSTEENSSTWLALMQRGLKVTAVGLGIGVFFFTVGGPWALGAIPFFIGIGQIISAKIRQKYEQK